LWECWWKAVAGCAAGTGCVFDAEIEWNVCTMGTKA